MMNDIINLISVARTEDSDGYFTDTETMEQVFCNVKSVSRTEFYEAYKAGLSLALSIEMWNDEYAGQKEIEYNNKRYRVERTYMKDRQTIELNCSEVIR